MSGLHVKICGLSTENSVRKAVECGASYVGFVFFRRSPRNVTAEAAAKLAMHAGSVPTVAVLVSPSDEDITGILAHFKPHYLQLHGKESPERVREIKQRFGLPVIKALSVSNAADIDAAAQYESVADMLLLDAKVTGGLPGGNGANFDWALLKGRKFGLPWFLSGGLNADNVEEALRVSGAALLDISSGVESAPGVKSPELIHKFLGVVKDLDI